MRSIIATLLTAVLLQPGLSARTKQMSTDQQIEHALSRLAWGAQPGDAAVVKRIGLRKWIEQQLHPEKLAENPELQKRLETLPNLKADTGEMFGKFRDRRQEAIRPIVKDVTEAKIYRAVYTNRQLEDVLADFWFNHFNVFMSKGPDRVFTGAYERDAIRPHVLGKFRDLVAATAAHPAMLWYLDNWQSVGNNAPGNRFARRAGKKGARGLNENYGRELLELHTLGVDGGYTQKDVIEVARCFTGWTVRDGKFQFVPGMHDPGEKIVLGVKIPAGGGQSDGEKVIDLVSSHPSTAKFISRKLAQRFVADEPPAALVEAMAKTFLRTNGSIRDVVRTMVQSKEFRAIENYRSKLKSPFELVVSAARAGQADLRNGIGLAFAAAQLGQPLYRKQEPTGYPNSSEDWQNSASLLARMNLAAALARNEIPGMDVKWPEDPLTLLTGEPSDRLKESLITKSDPKAGIETVLGSPDFQRR